ncbi:MAG: type I methionyl aminopeptidase [Rickettsiales bacterium]|nr:type I methionyl aminopeptidase [Rickettsiales bacterium]
MLNITIHKPEDFEGMRKAGRLASQILTRITDYVQAGVTTNELNNLCHNWIIEAGAIPAPLNYRGFPKSICTSVNHVVCHGIPDERKLREGDIVNIDVTVIVDGWYGDSSRMYMVGKKIPVKAQRLAEVAKDAMMLGIEQVRPGASLWEIGNAIQTYAEKQGFSVVRDYCGHGIGRIFHTTPNVVHYRDEASKKIILQEGMFFTIEPMINAGKAETILSLADGWTVTTRDKSLSAQWEHTIGVTNNGFEIFTVG